MKKEKLKQKKIGLYIDQHQNLMINQLRFEILVTGDKVVDLLAPYAKGGKIGFVWRSWSWKKQFLLWN